MKRVLSKSQMSRIRGGAWWHCKVVTKVTETECDIVLEGPEVDIEASSAIEAAICFTRSTVLTRLIVPVSKYDS